MEGGMAVVVTQRKTPQTLLVDWANNQDAWVRYIVGETVSSKQQMASTAIDTAYEYLLIEKELKQGTAPKLLPLNVSGENGENVQVLQLIRLGDVDGVNALCGGQEVIFSPRLTVLFGENAAGKSGYVRVLKRLAAVRSPEEVLPNLLAGGGPKPQKASIEYKLDDKEDTHEWKGEAGVSPFTRITVFDTKAVAVHLDEDLTYIYTPRDLALFRIAHDAIEDVKQRLDEQRKKVLPQGNPFVSLFMRGTSVYSKIETLGPQTDLQELKRLAMVPEEEVTQLPDLRGKVEALKSQSGELRLQAAKGDLSLFERAGTVSAALEAFDWSAYNQQVAAVETARQKHEDATVNAFKGLAIPGVLSAEWRRFVEAGEGYIRSSTPSGYPAEGASCTYCNQPLQAAAVSLIQKYRDFTNNQLKQDVTNAQATVESLARSIVKLAITDVSADFSNRIAAMSGTVPPAFAQAEQFFQVATPIQERLRKDESASSAESELVSTLSVTVTPLMRDGAARAEELINTLTAEAFERERLLGGYSGQLASLEARLKLRELIVQVEEYVNNAKWASSAERVSGTFGGLSRSLTVVSKTASEDLVNQDFERLFQDECRALRAPQVKLEFPGRDAQPKRRKSLVPRHALSEILSEGEQKVIALADFLAEAGMPQTNAPVIFDDPVNSLDYKRLQYVVDRIVQLSAERQVIVFTHNIWFTAEALNRFEKNPGDCKYYEVSSEDKVPGKVEALLHPKWDTPKEIGKQVNSRIQMAEKQTGVMREDLIRGAWGQIRSWCETFIEKEVLADVTARYRPHVRMTSLPNIKTELLKETISLVLPIFEKACRITEAHSQPLETLCVKPALDELKEDWATLQAERQKHVGKN
ncbi:MAG: AAA family ATPase [Vicinamibacterales bacterium]